MADPTPKSEEQILQELESNEIAGTVNPWEAKQDRYTNTILGESAGTDFSQQTLSTLIRRDKNRLEGVQNRTAMVVAVEPLSSYEELQFNLSRNEKNNGAMPANLQKVYTRNAESKTYFLNPPWRYNDTIFDKYMSSIMRSLHTYGIEGDVEEKAQPGNFYEQLYEDETQEKAKLLRKTKEGFSNFPSISSPSQVFTSNAASESVENVAGGDNPPTVTTLGGSNFVNFPEGDLVKQVKAAGWNPEYNPCAVPAGSNRVPSNRIGRNRFVALSGDAGKGDRSDFGPRFLSLYGKVKFHQGQDLGVGGAYPIVAVQDGVVSRILMNGTDRTKDNSQPTTVDMCLVTIDHTQAKDYPKALKDKKIEVRTTYMHLLKVGEKTDGSRLQVGDVVRAGDTIGLMGGGKGWPGSDNTTGPHLHFEVGVRQVLGPKKFKYDKYDDDRFVVKLTNGGTQGYGAVDPIHFTYPKLATFSKEKQKEFRKLRPKSKEKKKKNQDTNTTTTTSTTEQTAQDSNSNQQEDS